MQLQLYATCTCKLRLPCCKMRYISLKSNDYDSISLAAKRNYVFLFHYVVVYFDDGRWQVLFWLTLWSWSTSALCQIMLIITLTELIRQLCIRQMRKHCTQYTCKSAHSMGRKNVCRQRGFSCIHHNKYINHQ